MRHLSLSLSLSVSLYCLSLSVTVKSELGLEFSLSFSCLSYVCGMQCWHHAYLTTHEEEAASGTLRDPMLLILITNLGPWPVRPAPLGACHGAELLEDHHHRDILYLLTFG